MRCWRRRTALTASPLFWAVPSVSTWNDVPPDVNVGRGVPGDHPGVSELNVTLPVAVGARRWRSCPLSRDRVAVGVGQRDGRRSCRPAPGPWSASERRRTGTVNVCSSPTSLTSSGAIAIEALADVKGGRAGEVLQLGGERRRRTGLAHERRHARRPAEHRRDVDAELRERVRRQVGDLVPARSKFGHGPPSMLTPLLNAQIESAPLQP